MAISEIGDANQPMTADKLDAVLDIVDDSYSWQDKDIPLEVVKQVRKAAEHYFLLCIATNYSFALKPNIAQTAFYLILFYDAYRAGLANIEEPEP